MQERVSIGESDASADGAPKSELERVHITDIAFGGDGVGRLADGRTVFVPFTAVGDEVVVRITQERRRHCRGEIVEVVVPGAHRTLPRCPHFASCGGCHYQHLEIEEQLRLKTRQLKETLRRIGKFENVPPVAPLVRAPESYAYRNKIVLHPLPDVDGEVGFYAQDGRTVVRIEECCIANTRLNTKLSHLRKRGRLSGTTANLTLRCTHNGRVHSFSGRPNRKAAWMHEQVAGTELRVPLDGFSQVNPSVAEAMMAWVRTVLMAEPVESLIDLYCGAGAFTLAYADIAIQAVGVELKAESVAAARWSARRLGVENCVFVHGRAERRVRDILRKTPNPATATVILDPPREGCDGEVLEQLLAAPVGRIIYLSCDAGTLARDLSRLCGGGGYGLEQLALFDMFPQTAHFETAAVLRQR